MLIASTYASAASIASALSQCGGVHVDRISAVINATSFTYPYSGAADALVKPSTRQLLADVFSHFAFSCSSASRCCVHPESQSSEARAPKQPFKYSTNKHLALTFTIPRPQVASQCAGGFASSIVLVNTEQCEPEQLASLLHQMRHLCPTSRVVRTVAGRVTSRDDIVTLFLPREEEEGGPGGVLGFYSPAMVEARARICPGWDLPNSKQHIEDVWSERRGAITYLSFPIPSSSGITFIRAPLVMSIRSLFKTPNAALDTFVAASSAPGGAMDVLHLTACLPVAKTGQTSPEMCVIKAKRGCVTVTAVNQSEGVASSISVTGRNSEFQRLTTSIPNLNHA